MSKRKGISKSLRFEVFKRDSFKCQYCGRTPPEVILEVDHVVPVAEGGDNDPINLITSCKDCNRGKSAKRLDDNSALQRQRNQLEAINSMREQTEMMIEWKKSLMELENSQISVIEDCIHNRFSWFYGFNTYQRNKIKTLIRQFGFSEVYDSTLISISQYHYLSDVLEKIGGICYNRKKKRSESKKDFR